MVTIMDVAEAAGVSISTVSRVINQNSSVADETRKRVMEAVRDLEYVPNAFAGKSPHKSKKLIGVLFPDISNNVFGRIMQGINNVITPYGYNTIICETRGELEQEIHFLNVLKDKQVDGIIMANIHIPEEHMMWIHKHQKPVIYVCQDLPKFSLKVPCSSVNMDNRHAISDMVHHLYNMGHRSIAFVGGPMDDLSAGKNRYEGYVNGMRECGLPVQEDLVTFQESFSIEAGYNGMHHVYEVASLLPTAVLCASDNMAVGAIGFLYDNNIPVPQHMSVTGVDDSNLASAIRPSLTTIRHATEETGVKAALLLLGFISAPDSEGRAYNVPYQILRRQSVLHIVR